MTKKHTHKYKRIMSGQRPIYRCMLPGCYHFIGEEHIEHKLSLCHRCNKEFVITQKMLFPRAIVKPHCDDCNRPTFNRRTGTFQKGAAVAPPQAPQAPTKSEPKGHPEVRLDYVDDILRELLK